MQIEVIKLGKPAAKEYEALVNEFHKRLKPFCRIENTILKFKSADDFKSQGWLDKVAQYDCLVALDERGKVLSSIELADAVKGWQEEPRIKRVGILIGGPYGLDEETRKKAHLVWSLSKAVFPSDLAWLIVWEQLYRSSQIIKGTPYHHV